MDQSDLRWFEKVQGESLALLRTLVELESPSTEKAAVDRLGAFVSSELQHRGACVERIAARGSGDHLRAVFDPGRGADQILVLGHLDTVWDVGTLARRPFRIQEGRAYGPGILDMKAGILTILRTLEAIQGLKLACPSRVVVWLSGDEEIGSFTSREHVEQEARRSKCVLCLEPPLPGGLAKTSRKGVGRFVLRVRGRAAHAGVDHEKGINAIEELARQITRVQGWTDYAAGITLNAGTIRGGIRSNVVPDEAWTEVDVRVPSLEAGRKIEEAFASLRPFHPGAELHVEGSIERPPLERTEQVLRLYHRARDIASRLGRELGEGSTGGGSDGSLAAALGIPTLDGLGVDGDGAHAAHEHVLVDDVPFRCALLTRLLAEL